MKKIGIGLLGFGTVGAGVVDCLQKNGNLIQALLGKTLLSIFHLTIKSSRELLQITKFRIRR